VERAEGVQEIADRLLTAWDEATVIDGLGNTAPAFGPDDGYDVLAAVRAQRRSRGWQGVGRKIGFTNRSLWPLFGVEAPMWADIWDRTVIHASAGHASLSLAPFVQPRIEPEVVFELSGPVPPSADASAVMEHVSWIAAGFEVVHCHLQGWQFTLADAIADFGLHGSLVIGTPLIVDDGNRAQLADALATFEATLSCDGSFVDRGVGANVLGSPALALADLAAVVAEHHPDSPLSAGEIVTTGTITGAAPIAPGQTWTSDYGALGLAGLTLTLS
jgi:2-oxo-3-hexenedioate decarboxylase